MWLEVYLFQLLFCQFLQLFELFFIFLLVMRVFNFDSSGP